MSDDIKALRMDAYYYGFEPTGVDAVDLVLSAVACAGKSAHHTDLWTESAMPREYLEGDSPVDWIQNAAKKAADRIETLERELAEARKDAQRYRWLRSVNAATGEDYLVIDDSMNVIVGQELDSAIDAAMKDKP